MRFNLVVHMNNASFSENPGELSRILEKLAHETRHGVPAGPVEVILDVNGNSVGYWTVERG